MKQEDLSLRDYFAAQAMLSVSMETQETRIASFWDWVKNILKEHLYCSFLTVNFISVDGAYEKMAKKAYELADAMMNERENKKQSKTTERSITKVERLKHFLNQLPDGYRERALAQIDESNIGHLTDHMQSALIQFNDWNKTKEKKIFWRDVYDHYGAGTPLPPLPTE